MDHRRLAIGLCLSGERRDRALQVVLERVPLNTLSETEAAYIAGLIDGEGSISLSPQSAGFRCPHLSVSSNDRELLDWLLEKTGVGTTIIKKRAVGTHATQYQWAVKNRRAIAVLEQIEPYLRIAKKRARTAHLIGGYEAVTPRNGYYTPEMRTLKEHYEQQFFEL